MRSWAGAATAAHRLRVDNARPDPGVALSSTPVGEPGLLLSAWVTPLDQAHLRFNWRLIMLPPEIIDYVVVHELAHLLAPGHNPRFWNVVAAVLPNWQKRRQWLNRYGSPFLLWQA